MSLWDEDSIKTMIGWVKIPKANINQFGMIYLAVQELVDLDGEPLYSEKQARELVARLVPFILMPRGIDLLTPIDQMDSDIRKLVSGAPKEPEKESDGL